MIFYFSGTGNSKWLANEIAKATSDTLVDMANAVLTQACTFDVAVSERIGFVFPIHSWGPPRVVLAFIKALILQQVHNNYTYMAVTCGDDIGETTRMLARQLRRKGLELSSAFSVRMPNTYVSFPGFDIDDDSVQAQKLLEAKLDAENACSAIKNYQREIFKVVPGSFSFIKSYVLRPLSWKFINSDRFFSADSRCVSCNRCVKVCPMHNISMKANLPAWHGHCTGCLSCYHCCPTHALNFGKLTQQKGQYHYSNKPQSNN